MGDEGRRAAASVNESEVYVCVCTGKGRRLLVSCLCLVGAQVRLSCLFHKFSRSCLARRQKGVRNEEITKCNNCMMGLGHAASTFNWRINYRPLRSACAICIYLTRIIGSVIKRGARLLCLHRKKGEGEIVSTRRFGCLAQFPCGPAPHNQSHKATRPIGSQLGFFVP